jgi:hypothetical protein
MRHENRGRCTRASCFTAFKIILAVSDLLGEASDDASAIAAEVSREWWVIFLFSIASLLANSPAAFYDLKQMGVKLDSCCSRERVAAEGGANPDGVPFSCWHVTRFSFALLVYAAYIVVVYNGAREDFHPNRLQLGNATRGNVSAQNELIVGQLSNASAALLAIPTSIPWIVFEGSTSLTAYAGPAVMHYLILRAAAGCRREQGLPQAEQLLVKNQLSEAEKNTVKRVERRCGKAGFVLGGLMFPFLCFQAWNLLDVFCTYFSSLTDDPGNYLLAFRVLSFTISFPGLYAHFVDYNMQPVAPAWTPRLVVTSSVRGFSVFSAGCFYLAYGFNHFGQLLNDTFDLSTAIGTAPLYGVLVYAVLEGLRSVGRNIIYSYENPIPVLEAGQHPLCCSAFSSRARRRVSTVGSEQRSGGGTPTPTQEIALINVRPGGYGT